MAVDILAVLALVGATLPEARTTALFTGVSIRVPSVGRREPREARFLRDVGNAALRAVSGPLPPLYCVLDSLWVPSVDDEINPGGVQVLGNGVPRLLTATRDQSDPTVQITLR
jgi:hypothetical protein